jgi:uncharacterized membrane protein (DUF485 family)
MVYDKRKHNSLHSTNQTISMIFSKEANCNTPKLALCITTIFFQIWHIYLLLPKFASPMLARSLCEAALISTCIPSCNILKFYISPYIPIVKKYPIPTKNKYQFSNPFKETSEIHL